MDIEVIKRLYAAGNTDKEIAAVLNCTRSSVSRTIRKLGLRPPTPPKRQINVDQLKAAVAAGTSFSQFARDQGFFDKNGVPAVALISSFAKRYGIVSPSDLHKRLKLPDAEIYSAYLSGVSLDKLKDLYGTSVQTIKRHLLLAYPDIVFRTRDEAIRPALLNDSIALAEAHLAYSCHTIARRIGVKVSTVTAAMKRHGLAIRNQRQWDDIEYGMLLDMYTTKLMRPRQIAIALGYPYSRVLRQLRKNGFKIAKVGGNLRPSKHQQLNDPKWLHDQYVVQKRSIGDLSSIVGTSLHNIIHHLRKHEIPLRSRAEYLELLLKNKHGNQHTHNGIECDSSRELVFLRSLSPTTQIVRGPQLEAKGSHCHIDFVIDGQYTEVKPNDFNGKNVTDHTQYALLRRRGIKQFQICKHNNIDLTFWTGGYYTPVITDLDRYYAVNWKLFFESDVECADWLLSRGFEAPQYHKLELADAAAVMLKCKAGNELNANCPNTNPSKLVHHFFPHFWGSTHKGYMPPKTAWDIGNRTVLRYAMAELWGRASNEPKHGSAGTNIYGLLKLITKRCKDFSTVSIFKPWVAAEIYRRFLPNGGVVIDPSCGWGGRLMGTVDKPIKYIGYDLNPLSISGHTALAKFINNELSDQPEFHLADSSVVDFADGDLLFTSPPYDDTESYHGIDSTVTKTEPILDNIFRKFSGHTVVLNIPKRQGQLCKSIGTARGWQLIETLEMKTASFMGRQKTFEPILVFKR